MELKPLPTEAVPAALKKAKHYRLLNEPAAAESICLDILRVDSENREALVILILAMSDHSGGGYKISDHRVEDLIAQIPSDYERAYYTGLVAERRGLAKIRGQSPGSSYVAYECLTTAMSHFEEALALSHSTGGESTLRWNTCARLIERNNLAPRPVEHLAELGD
ncbi:MAG: hypothetical protein OSB65_08410 [Roseibacillus sp.]|nr:hypothetical protein [Roseibacillus sp.]